MSIDMTAKPTSATITAMANEAMPDNWNAPSAFRMAISVNVVAREADGGSMWLSPWAVKVQAQNPPMKAAATAKAAA